MSKTKAPPPVDYPERAVAFIDILGFSNLVSRIADDEGLHRRLRRALTWFERMRESSQQPNTAQTPLEISVFSDSVVISSEPSDLHAIIHSILHLQAEMLGIGVLLRGGISQGRLVHKGNLIYGDGMLRAYELESKVAVYPRVVLDENLVHSFSLHYRQMFLQQDSDSLWFLDPFSLGIGGVNAEALLEDGYDPHEVALLKLGREIDRQIATIPSAAQRVKWSWLKRQYDAAILQLKTHGEPRFWAYMKDKWPKNTK